MGYFLPETVPSKSDLTAKNRVWGFFGESDLASLESRPAARQLHRENYDAPRKSVSGIPFWPSRDPIGENGGVNLYGFVGNDGVSQWDMLGRQEGGIPMPENVPKIPDRFDDEFDENFDGIPDDDQDFDGVPDDLPKVPQPQPKNPNPPGMAFYSMSIAEGYVVLDFSRLECICRCVRSFANESSDDDCEPRVFLFGIGIARGQQAPLAAETISALNAEADWKSKIPDCYVPEDGSPEVMIGPAELVKFPPEAPPVVPDI